MWQFFIVPSKEDRRLKGASLLVLLNNFIELKEKNPEIKILYIDCEEEEKKFIDKCIRQIENKKIAVSMVNV